MSEDMRVESIKMEDSEDKFETLNYIQIITLKAETTSYLTYTIVKNYQKSLRREAFRQRSLIA